jgi:chromosome segregation ATPase
MRKFYLILSFFLVPLHAFGYTQADLLAAQDSYQDSRDNYEDCQNKLKEASKELEAAKIALINAQNDLKQKQNNYTRAKANLKSSGIAFTHATTRINTVWNSVNNTPTK